VVAPGIIDIQLSKNKLRIPTMGSSKIGLAGGSKLIFEAKTFSGCLTIALG